MYHPSRLLLVVIMLLAGASKTTTLSTTTTTTIAEIMSSVDPTTTGWEPTVTSIGECVVDSNSIINDELATTNNSLTFNWTLSESSSSLNCTNITICITSGADVCKYPSTNVNSGRVTFVDLTPGTTYMVNISVTDSTYGMTSDTASGTTKLIPPVSPGVVSVTERNITVNWTNPAANYNTVIINCTGLGDAKSDIVNVSNNKNIGTCSGLTPGAIYNIILSTALNSGATPPAETETLHSVTEPLKPAGVGLETVNTSAINITIDYPYNSTTGQCSEFRIKYRGNGTNTAELGTNITCTETHLVLGGLENNTLYSVNVSTVSKSTAGVSPKESDVTSNLTDGWTLPGSVTDLMVAVNGSRRAFTNWTQVHNQISVGLYVLEVSHNNQCHQQITFSVSGSVEIIPEECNRTCDNYKSVESFSESGYEVTGLTPYYHYVFNVTVINPGGCGLESNTVNVTTDQDIPGVIGPLLSIPSSYSMNVSWSSPSDPNGIISNYTIIWCLFSRVTGDYLMTVLDDCYNETTDNNLTSYVIDDLDAYTIYNVSVAAHTVIGQGDFFDIVNDTLMGEPFPAINVMASTFGSDAIRVSWSLSNDAYPTGPYVGYNVTATPLDDTKSGVQEVIGFNSTETTVYNLTSHVNYTVCVQAYARDDQYNIIYANVQEPCVLIKTEEAAPEAIADIKVEKDNICDKMNISWSPPSNPHGIVKMYNITLVNVVDESYIHEVVNHIGNQDDKQNWTASVDPNNKNYNITIWAKTVEWGPPYSRNASSGICSPTVIKPDVITNPGKMSKTSFDVELARCSLCHNSNGDITFLGLIITENIDFNNTNYIFATKKDFDKVFGAWNEYNKTVGYRTTPDDWNKTIDCNITCTKASGRSRREVAETFKYTVGTSDNCDDYCNHKLEDSKDTRKFKVRLAVGTAGGIFVTEMSSDPYELKPNKAWIAAPVIICLLVVAALVALIIIMHKKRMGPFNESSSNTRTVQFPAGTTNPAFVDEPAIERPNPVKVSDFMDYVTKRSSDSDLLFSEEYKLIQEMSPKHPVTYAELQNNRLKNRFVNILPFDHSRVKLQAADDDETSDYINANYMPGYNSKREFIASQGPMKSTVDDFWRMIWEQNVPLIVMLTQLEERGRERCAKYWPSDNEPMYYGELQVQLRSESVIDSYVIRILDIQLANKKRSIKQMHFIRWPDFGVPENPEMLLDFVTDVRIHLPHEINGAILVHCSAGVGRTGSFIAIDRLLQHIKYNSVLDIFSVVLEMRNYRLYMIQVEAQYVLIHKCILAAIRSGLHETPNNIYDDCTDENIYENT